MGKSDWKCTHSASIIEDTDTYVKIRVTCYWQNVGWTYNINYVSAWVYCGSSSTLVKDSGSINAQSSSSQALSCGYADFTINKTHAKQTIDCSAKITSNSTYASGTRTSATTNLSVSAKTSYTITYNANGGTGAPAAQTKWHDERLDLSTAKPTRDGYTFLGWHYDEAQADAGVVYYYLPDENWCGQNKNLTLYAVWEANTYTIKYDANNGQNAPANQTKTHDITLKLSNTTPTRTGYTFLGWSTSETATTATYTAGANYTTNGSATLYAVWEANTYKVEFNANGGTGAPEAQTKTYGKTLALSSTKPTRSGYNFEGWATSATATKAEYAAGANYAANAPAILYAVWSVAYKKPTIAMKQLYRCTENGTKSDNGTYARVQFDWTTYHDVDSITINWLRGSTLAGSKTLHPSGTSGTVDEIVGTFSIENSYTIKIEVTDNGGTTPVTRTLGGQKFPVNILSTLKGLALNKVAELTDYFDVAFKTRFRDLIEVDHGKSIYSYSNDGTKKSLLTLQNNDDNLVIGYDNYDNDAAHGNTNIYGHDIQLGISNSKSKATFRPYLRVGDSISIVYRGAGFVGEDGLTVNFYIPLTKPIIGNPTITVSSGNGFKLMQNGTYTHGSWTSTHVTPDSYSATGYSNSGISVVATFSDAKNATELSPIGIYWHGTISFS